MSTQLVLLHQEALVTEKFGRNGVVKDLHVVAKSLPFVLELGSKGLDLNCVGLEALLVYDFDDDDEPERRVEALKSKPLEYCAHINAKDSATIECRISVLTSQHANSYFRVRVCCIDPNTKERIQVTSHAIKVISKANQVHRQKQTPGHRKERTPPSDGSVSGQTPSPTSLSTNNSDAVLELLHRMEEQNAMQHLMLRALLTQKEPQESHTDFELAFKTFLASYSSLDSEERPRKVRRVISQLSPADHANLTEVIGVVAEGSLQRMGIGSAPVTLSVEDDDGEQQLESCLVEEQQSKVDNTDMYMELFSSPVELTTP